VKLALPALGVMGLIVGADLGGLIGTAPNVLATHPGRRFKTFADVIATAKAKPDSVSYGSVGNGSLGHLTMVLLSQRAGVKMVHVPYRGGVRL
jgi:tripartite-type tricarboxylate transporter receptor subunit TctC